MSDVVRDRKTFIKKESMSDIKLKDKELYEQTLSQAK